MYDLILYGFLHYSYLISFLSIHGGVNALFIFNIICSTCEKGSVDQSPCLVILMAESLFVNPNHTTSILYMFLRKHTHANNICIYMYVIDITLTLYTLIHVCTCICAFLISVQINAPTFCSPIYIRYISINIIGIHTHILLSCTHIPARCICLSS